MPLMISAYAAKSSVERDGLMKRDGKRLSVRLPLPISSHKLSASRQLLR